MAHKNKNFFLQRTLVNLFVIIILADSLAQETANERAIVAEPGTKTNNTDIHLVENIRRQLMINNYDYDIGTSSDEGITYTTPNDLEDVTVVTGDNGDKPPTSPEYGDMRNNYANKYLIEKPYEVELPEKRYDNFQKQVTHKPPSKGEDYNDPPSKSPDYRNRDADQYPNQINKSPEPRYNSADELDNTDHKDVPDKFSDDHKGIPARYSEVKEEGSSNEVLIPMTPPNFNSLGQGNVVQRAIVSKYDVKHGFEVSPNDLLYYMDDKRMRRSNYNNLSSVSMEGDQEQDATQSSAPKAKYKLISVRRKPGSGRRQMPRRLVEVRNEDGVEILRTDDQPFPQFQLPRDRRQYMSGEQDAKAQQTDSNTS